MEKKSHVQQSSVLQGLMKVHGSRRKYKGGWDEDLFGTIKIYEISATMCNITADERRVGTPVMLEEGALSYYASHIRNSARTYDEAIQMLKHRFASEEQRTGLLHEWRDISLTAWFRRFPDKYQSTVFREMCDKLTSVQRQLHPDYRKPRFLRD